MIELQMLSFAFPAADYYFERPWTLSGVTYLFTFRFNNRMQLWFMDIADATGAIIIAGVALRAPRDLLPAYPTRPLPKGQLVVFDASGKNLDPTADSFASTHSLLYGTYQ